MLTIVSDTEPGQKGRTAILALLAAAQLAMVLDFSIVTLALPAIQRQFGLTSGDLQWVVSTYGLTSGGLLLLGGRLADLFDRRRVFMVGLVLFAGASLAGGLATAAAVVAAARAVQGVGAAILSPAVLALLQENFPEGVERNRAMSLMGVARSAGFATGVILGGGLVGLAGWRWIFFVNVPLAVVALVVAARVLPVQRSRSRRRRLDLAGALLGTAGTAALVAGLSIASAPNHGQEAAGLLAIAAVLLLAFIVVERSASDPLVPLDIFQHRPTAAANLVSGLTLGVAAMLAFTLTLVVQRAMGFSPLAASLIFLPSGIGGAVAGTAATVVVQRFGPGRTALGGVMVMVAGALLMLPGLSGSAVWLAAGYALVGAGIVGTGVSTMISATAGIGRERQGMAGGLLSTFQQVGSALGVALAAFLTVSATLAAYRWAIVVAAMLLAGAFLLAATMLRTPARTRTVAKPVTEAPLAAA